MKHKIGDKVQIKSKEWFDAQEDDGYGSIVVENEESDFVDYMVIFCGCVGTVVDVDGCSYILDIDEGEWYWQDWMLE